MTTSVEQINFRIDSELKKELSRVMYEKAAADPDGERWSLNRCFNEAIEKYIEEHKNA